MVQSHTQAWVILNTALLGSGQEPLTSAAQYTSGIHSIPSYSQSANNLSKYQQIGVTWLDILHQTLALVMNKRFMWRDFQFETVGPTPPTPLYRIPNVIVEGFRANSFFNITYGAGPGNRIGVITKQEFLEMYARPDIVPFGSPLWLVPETEDASGMITVRLVPTPDQAYTIQGTSRLLVPPITSGSDEVVFPYYYQQPLVVKLMQIIEMKLDEGRDVPVAQLAQQFVDELLRDSGGALEESEQIDFGLRLYHRGYGESHRDYNPTTDIAGPYP